MKRHPLRSIASCGATRAIARVARAAAALPLLALPFATPTALAQSANPWMDPNLVVAVTKGSVELFLNDLKDPTLPDTVTVTVVDQLRPRPIYLLRPARNQSVNDLMDRLRHSTRIQQVFVGLNRRLSSPEAGELKDQFGPIRRGGVSLIGEQAIADSRVPAGWTDAWLDAPALQAQSRGDGVTVAVLDTGIDLAHPSFVDPLSRANQSRLKPGKDFVDDDLVPAERRGTAYGHGTHVAGVIARVAPGAKILPVRVLDANGFGTLWTVAKGTVFALDPDGIATTPDGARVLNMSFGADVLPVKDGLTPGEDGVLRTLIKLASCHADLYVAPGPFTHSGFNPDRARCSDRPRRSIVVAGEGNDVRAKALVPADYSASMPSVLAVTASDPRGFRAVWATRGAGSEIVAPGDWIMSAYPMPERVAIMSGTSMATPWVSGVSALLIAKRGAGLPTDSIRTVMRSTGKTMCDIRPLGIEVAPLRAMGNVMSYESACR